MKKQGQWLGLLSVVLGLVVTIHGSIPPSTSAQQNPPLYQPIAQLGRGAISSVSWRPHQNIIAIGGELGLWLYTDRFEAIDYIKTDLPIRAVAWSPDSTRLASGSADNTIQIWDALNDFQPLHTLSAHTDDIWSIAWHPDNIPHSNAAEQDY